MVRASSHAGCRGFEPTRSMRPVAMVGGRNTPNRPRLFSGRDFVNALHHVTDELRPGNMDDAAGRFIPAILVQMQFDGSRRFIEVRDPEMGAGDRVSSKRCHVFLASHTVCPAKPDRITPEYDNFVKTAERARAVLMEPGRESRRIRGASGGQPAYLGAAIGVMALTVAAILARSASGRAISPLSAR